MEVNQKANMNKDDHKKKKTSDVAGRSTGGSRSCQVDNCMVDLAEGKQYHRRHRVCEYHSKSQVVAIGGIRQRFCQQCSRFHELTEFDEAKRSCRRRLAGHNERRRKSTTADSQSEGATSTTKGTGSQLKENLYGQVDERGKVQFPIQDHAIYKHFQIK